MLKAQDGRNFVQISDLLVSCLLLSTAVIFTFSDGGSYSWLGQVKIIILMLAAFTSFLASLSNNMKLVFLINVILGSVLALIALTYIVLVILYSKWDLYWFPVSAVGITSYLILGVFFLFLSGLVRRSRAMD